MKHLFKITLLFISFVILSSTSYANESDELAAKNLANQIKTAYVDLYGSFPAELDETTYILDITSDKQSIIYDYKITGTANVILINYIVEYFRKSLEITTCRETKSVNLLKEHQISVLFRFALADQNQASINLSADEICN